MKYCATLAQKDCLNDTARGFETFTCMGIQPNIVALDLSMNKFKFLDVAMVKNCFPNLRYLSGEEMLRFKYNPLPNTQK